MDVKLIKRDGRPNIPATPGIDKNIENNQHQSSYASDVTSLDIP